MENQTKKLRLDELKVDSFVTIMDNTISETAKGGIEPAICTLTRTTIDDIFLSWWKNCA